MHVSHPLTILVPSFSPTHRGDLSMSDTACAATTNRAVESDSVWVLCHITGVRQGNVPAIPESSSLARTRNRALWAHTHAPGAFRMHIDADSVYLMFLPKPISRGSTRRSRLRTLPHRRTARAPGSPRFLRVLGMRNRTQKATAGLQSPLSAYQ